MSSGEDPRPDGAAGRGTTGCSAVISADGTTGCSAVTLGSDTCSASGLPASGWPPEAMPFKTGLVFTYECGAFEKNMDIALDASDWAGFPERRTEAARRNRLRGIGVANAIEIAGGRHLVVEEHLSISNMQFDARSAARVVDSAEHHIPSGRIKWIDDV